MRALLLASAPLLGIACAPAAATQEPATATSAPKATESIVQTASNAGSFKTLVTALQAADLVSTLDGAGPFTVFAPTDAAFAKLPAGTVESLLKPENKDKLRAVLTYYVVSGRIASSEIPASTRAKTVQGQELTIAKDGAGVRVDAASVVTPDIACSNGVIHVIDAVVLPK